MAEIKQDRKYADSHEWVKLEGDIAEIGITDFAQDALGDLVYVEGEDVDTEVEKGESIGSLESVKMASDLFTPIAGTIIEVNEELEDSPEKVNEAPYENWIVKLKVSDKADYDALMDADAYQKFCDSKED